MVPSCTSSPPIGLSSIGAVFVGDGEGANEVSVGYIVSKEDVGLGENASDLLYEDGTTEELNENSRDKPSEDSSETLGNVSSSDDDGIILLENVNISLDEVSSSSVLVGRGGSSELSKI